jgi:hypothetical protein
MSDVAAMIETMPLERAQAYVRMMSSALPGWSHNGFGPRTGNPEVAKKDDGAF